MTNLALVLVLLAPSIDAGIWGVHLGTDQESALQAFRPGGRVEAAYWERRQSGRVTELTFVCRAQQQCYGLPTGATLRFLDGRLAEATLRIESEKAPPGADALAELRAQLAATGLKSADATTRVVGRHTRYFLRPGHTIVWIQDGPDAELKIFDDLRSPLGRAEAVGSGASSNLKTLPGAASYAAAHREVGRLNWTGAIEHLDESLKSPGISPLLASPARLVLAMALAARAKKSAQGNVGRTGGLSRAVKDLNRAEVLAPSLGEHLRSLRRQLGL